MAAKGDEGHGERLRRVREGMAAAGLDALVVRGTDRYLNEYVPSAQSLRIWLSGFTGSMGDLVVGKDEAHVLVDGRYHLQAERETDPRHFTVDRLALDRSIEDGVVERLVAMAAKQPELAVGYEPEKVSVDFARRLRAAIEGAGGRAVATAVNLVAAARGEVPAPAPGALAAVPPAVTGESPQARLARVRERLAERSLDGAVVTRLDEIAWLTNLRGSEIDYAATFRGLGWVGREACVLFLAGAPVDAGVLAHLGDGFEVAAESSFPAALAAHLPRGRRLRVLVDPEGTSEAVREALADALGAQGEVVLEASPIQAMKARKSAAELRAMRASFRRADEVVTAAIAWLNRRLGRGHPVTERDLAEQVEALFRAAGASRLSFRVIAAAGESGAVIHYSHPDPERRIRKGELVLLDTGAYFAEGYATDLTRTFLAGGAAARPTRRQRQLYTLVLKAAIRGMKARFPRGTTGLQLDAVVRAPLWEEGLDYLHGTGHGVGILVHEFPPRVATRASAAALEPGMVFSIEPGVYLPGWGGIRIENLVTVVEDGTAPGFLRVSPMTFAPLDRRLIDGRLLSVDEKRWLRRWQRGRGR